MKKIIGLLVFLIVFSSSVLALDVGDFVLVDFDADTSRGGTATVRLTTPYVNVNTHTIMIGMKVKAPDGEIYKQNTFCTDLLQTVTLGSTNNPYTVSPLTVAPDSGPMGKIAAENLQRLWSSNYDNLLVDAKIKDNCSAFQLAVWEIVYDTKANGTYSLLDGNFTASGHNTQVANLAKQFLKNAVDTSVPLRPGLFALTSPSRQDQLLIIPSYNSVPEASTLVFGMLASGTLLLHRKRNS
jgi:hypothetical protein